MKKFESQIIRLPSAARVGNNNNTDTDILKYLAWLTQLKFSQLMNAAK
jgi:hypothetical protein